MQKCHKEKNGSFRQVVKKHGDAKINQQQPTCMKNMRNAAMTSETRWTILHRKTAQKRGGRTKNRGRFNAIWVIKIVKLCGWTK